MTNIPAGLYTGSAKIDLARAVIALQAITTPSPALAANTATGTAAFKVNTGVRNWFDSFKLTEEAGVTSFKLEIPYSAKLLGSYGDIRKSIAPLPGVGVAVWAGTAGSGSPGVAADNLERYAYDRALDFAAAKANDETIAITPKVDAVTGRAYISIEGVFNTTISSLLAGIGGGGGGNA